MSATGGVRERRLRGAAILVHVLGVLTISLAGLAASSRWVGTTFPGFFLMRNRVVPSVGLSSWTGLQGPSLFQRQVVALDGVPVRSAAGVYAPVAAAPSGRSWRYTLRGGEGEEIRTVSSMPFAWRDYLLMFGPLLLNGLVFSAVGIVVWVLGARTPMTLGATVFMLDVGIFALTAMDLYGPGTLFRLHVATEALFPVVLLHLALVFPVPRFGSHRRPLLAAAYLVGLAVAAAYEWSLYDAEDYSRVHNVCMAAVGLAGVGLIGSCAHAYATSASPLVRRRLAVIAVGMLTGLALPAWVLATSGLVGGQRGITLANFTAFLFPLALAYAVVKHDLFEIDALLRRGVGHLALTGVVVSVYGALALASGWVLQTTEVARSSAFPLVFAFLLAVFFDPLRQRIQRLVDRAYARSRYDSGQILERASAELVAMLDLKEICRLTIDTLRRALLVEQASLWLRDGDRFVVAESRGVARLSLKADHPLLEQLRRSPRAISVHDFAEAPGGDAGVLACKRALNLLDAHLVVPLGAGQPSGFVTLGRKHSNALFTLDDVEFITTFANQIAVAIHNARSYRKVEELNLELERKVEQRTRELGMANERLATSVRQLERAYDDLQHSQESLVHAEKMATLGQLAAGIAHEVNNPLGAALNGLKVMRELAIEYADSVGDPQVSEDDHRELAGELRQQLDNVSRWTSMAAAYVRSVKTHTQGIEDVRERLFDLGQLIEDTRLLLAHRLRVSCCTMTIDCPGRVSLWGDSGKLGQVLTNLVTNAIDAYEGTEAGEGVIRVRVVPAAGDVRVVVEDEGCGIPADQMSRIFEALFTTKSFGRGTGLGLSLCRDIVRNCFDGSIEVASTPAKGSRFTLVLARRSADTADAPRESAPAAGSAQFASLTADSA